ncbi:hypothetical protein [Streptomyces sp. NPDC059460]|uniref:hypothetical protein n=1 Tax=Streptomyces sp. NPDC059460 TaxID=3346840 RepID=UPI0036B539F7
MLDRAQGNPLALLELPVHLSGAPAEVAAAECLGLRDTPLPLPRRLQHVYGTRIDELSADVREELLRGALDGVGAAPGSTPAPGQRQYRMRDAREAVAAGLLDIAPVSGDFVFRHPLIRSTVVQTATPNQRRAAHSVLADVHRDDVERRAIHPAASMIDPDEEIANTLEAAADSATRRGGAAAAVAWLTRAAELSESHEERSRRLGDAAFVAGQAGGGTGQLTRADGKAASAVCRAVPIATRGRTAAPRQWEPPGIPMYGRGESPGMPMYGAGQRTDISHTCVVLSAPHRHMTDVSSRLDEYAASGRRP